MHEKLIVRDADTGAEKHAFEHGALSIPSRSRRMGSGSPPAYANKLIVRRCASFGMAATTLADSANGNPSASRSAQAGPEDDADGSSGSTPAKSQEALATSGPGTC